MPRQPEHSGCKPSRERQRAAAAIFSAACSVTIVGKSPVVCRIFGARGGASRGMPANRRIVVENAHPPPPLHLDVDESLARDFSNSPLLDAGWHLSRCTYLAEPCRSLLRPQVTVEPAGPRQKCELPRLRRLPITVSFTSIRCGGASEARAARAERTCFPPGRSSAGVPDRHQM